MTPTQGYETTLTQAQCSDSRLYPGNKDSFTGCNQELDVFVEVANIASLLLSAGGTQMKMKYHSHIQGTIWSLTFFLCYIRLIKATTTPDKHIWKNERHLLQTPTSPLQYQANKHVGPACGCWENEDGSGDFTVFHVCFRIF